ncbi:hypothetical protein [Chryseobacterium sp. ERMR1:04]|uniref:hypothetical protein n=1 Tax=Chryseobacterium sp. ERMR1:04 TaxID=1705393 RepID=UPI0008DDB598|nr:hypothetical protein [Chryseobacterium sp. ERMR1:04]
MEKKTIQIDKNIPKSVLIGFVLAFVTVFVVEHYSTFSYIPNLNTPSVDNEGKLILSGTYDPTTTSVATLHQTTPFGTKINLPTNGMMCSELILEGSDFKSYSNKGVLYAKSVFNDYKYLLLFWLIYTLIVLFFKRYRLKILILILPISILNYNKTQKKVIEDCITHKSTAKTDSTNKYNKGFQESDKTAVKHLF